MRPLARRTSSPIVLLVIWLAGIAAAGLSLVLIHDWITPVGAPWEHSWLLGIHRAAGPGLERAAAAVAQVGEPPAVALISVACALGWLWRRAGWKAGVFAGNLIALILLDYGGKSFFDRLRPELWIHQAEGGNAFPSGHALFAIGFYGIIAYLLLGRATLPWRIVGWAAWVLLAAALGGCRLVLGVHWPTDLLAGYVAGACVLVSGIAIARRLQPPH